jgi:cold shock protein
MIGNHARPVHVEASPVAREEQTMQVGTVKWFNNAKGWGFICRNGGPDVFVHYSQIDGDGFRTLRQGDEVQFDLRDGPRGQFAERVTRVT